MEDIIARCAESMGCLHLQVAVVEPTTDLVTKISNGSTPLVLKREWSARGHHVFSRHTADAVRKFERARSVEQQAYGSPGHHFPVPRWFVQPYNASLIKLGEYRVFLVNGIIYQTFVTTPKNGDITVLDVEDPVILTPLSMLW
jgi:hypothetical protein